MVTLFSLAREFPLLGIPPRVYLDFTPSSTAPASPYGLVWEKPGGVEASYYGGADTVRISPCLTVYWKPTGTQTAATIRRDLDLLVREINERRHAVDTHLDGVTPYVDGSFQHVMLTPPTPDKSNPGGYYATLHYTALIQQ